MNFNNELEEFKKRIKKEVRNNIGIDFDCVIHKNSLGFHDGTVYDEPIYGTKESLAMLSKRYDIIIYTCRANPNRPLINNKTGKELIWDWLRKYKLDIYITNVTHEKPRASFYIDDKAVRFIDWKSTLKEVI